MRFCLPSARFSPLESCSGGGEGEGEGVIGGGQKRQISWRGQKRIWRAKDENINLRYSAYKSHARQYRKTAKSSLLYHCCFLFSTGETRSITGASVRALGVQKTWFDPSAAASVGTAEEGHDERQKKKSTSEERDRFHEISCPLYMCAAVQEQYSRTQYQNIMKFVCVFVQAGRCVFALALSSAPSHPCNFPSAICCWGGRGMLHPTHDEYR